jgi:hypothetical protein
MTHHSTDALPGNPDMSQYHHVCLEASINSLLLITSCSKNIGTHRVSHTGSYANHYK